MANIEKVSTSCHIFYLNLMLNHGYIDGTISEYQYPGTGTYEDPYIVSWIAGDLRNPLLFKDRTKWL
jgi:hypothetical protein